MVAPPWSVPAAALHSGRARTGANGFEAKNSLGLGGFRKFHRSPLCRVDIIPHIAAGMIPLRSKWRSASVDGDLYPHWAVRRLYGRAGWEGIDDAK